MITRQYKIDNSGILIFDKDIKNTHADYHSQGLDKLYKAEEKHFWFIARKEFILKQMKHIIDMSAKIIEIGAGTGNVSRHLIQNGYKNLCVGEMHLNGLKYAQEYGINKCYQFNLLQTPFKNEFDAVCLFDVLEHIKDDSLALQNIHKTLRNDGYLVLTVPSHMWLWSRADSIAGHKTRYSKQILIKKLQDNGFEILVARYFFISIIPLLYLRTLLNMDNKSNIKHEELTKTISINPLLNKILLFISRIENKITNFLPNLFGGSLFIIVRKHDKL